MVESSRREEQSVAPGARATSGAGGLGAELARYPELEVVLWLVVSVVVEAYSIDENADPGKTALLERAAAEAMVVAYAPVAVSARHKAATADDAREARAIIVVRAADPSAAENEPEADEVSAVADELRSLSAALLVESMAIDTCYLLGVRAASSAARGLSAGGVPARSTPERQLAD